MQHERQSKELGTKLKDEIEEDEVEAGQEEHVEEEEEEHRQSGEEEEEDGEVGEIEDDEEDEVEVGREEDDSDDGEEEVEEAEEEDEANDEEVEEEDEARWKKVKKTGPQEISEGRRKATIVNEERQGKASNQGGTSDEPAEKGEQKSNNAGTARKAASNILSGVKFSTLQLSEPTRKGVECLGFEYMTEVRE